MYWEIALFYGSFIITQSLDLNVFLIDLAIEILNIYKFQLRSTCLIDPILTTLLKDVLHWISKSVLDQTSLYLLTGYALQAFKIVLILFSKTYSCLRGFNKL